MTITWILNNVNQVGGIEQVVCGLSTYFCNDMGYKVKIISLGSKESRVFFPLDSRVEITHGGLDFNTLTKKEMHKAIKEVFKTLDTDIVITCHCSISVGAIIHKRSLKGKLIVTEHASPRSYSKKRLLYNALFFRFADVFVNLTEDSRLFYKKYMVNSTVIPNAIFNRALERADLNSKTVLGAGRFEEVKGFDRLISAFAIAARNRPDWKLCLCGDGSMKESLLKQAEALGIKDRLILPGFVRNMPDYLEKSSVFALSSRSEAFPLVFLDAISHGLPVVSFDLPYTKGVGEEDGVLIAEQGNVEAFGALLESLMESRERLEALGEKAYKHSQQYTVPAICKRWKELFESLTNKK